MKTRLSLLAFALALGVLRAAEDKPTFVINAFDTPEDLKKLNWDKENLEISVGPRTVTEMNNVLKYSVLGGQWPAINFHVPNIPRDWSKYETLSFVAWTNSPCGVGIRVDDEKSFNYNSRYNGGAEFQKGRTLVQIPVQTIARSIDVTRVKMLAIFTCEPPKGLTIWFDDFMLGPTQTQKVDFIPYHERKDLISSLDVVTPHLPMARNLAGGPLPVFMLTAVRFGREVPEMMQRMDLKVSQLTWDREWGANTWGFGDFYGGRGHSADCALMQHYLDSSMQGPERFGAMMMYTPLGWNRFTESARGMIVRRVKERGEGLVMVFPFPGDRDRPWPEDLTEVCALIDSSTDWLRDGCDVRNANEGRIEGRRWVKTKEHPITAGVPIEALPFKGMETQKYRVAPGAEVLIRLESGEPVLAVKQVGKGRVVTFATRAFSLTPLMNSPQSYAQKIPYRFWEAWYSLANRSLLWAAGREFKREGAPVTLKVEGPHADEAFAVDQWKDAAGKVTDWELRFTPPSADAKPVELKVPEAVPAGQPIAVSFRAPEGAETARWIAVLGERVDGQWRTIESIPIPSAKGENGNGATVELPTTRFRQYMANIRVEARVDGRLVAQGKAETIVTPRPVWDDYEVHTWLEFGLPFLRDFEMTRMREFGLTANTSGPRDDDASRSLLRGGMRVHGCGFTQGLHAKDIDAAEKRYRQTQDRKFLIRNPSYGDAAFVEKERRDVMESARQISKFGAISMILSDETALTSYTREFDYDEHPGILAAFREKLQKRFGGIAALNDALKTSFKSFDEIQPPTGEEARANRQFGLFNEWRAHNDDGWTGAFAMYGEAMKSVYPEARLSVSGSQEQAVFNGIDWAKLTPTFGAISGYGGRFQELQRLSFHPGGLRSTPWGGYGRSGRSVDHQLWSSLAMGGSGIGLFWWYSLRNADLTFCRSGQDYRRVIAEMRNGTAKQYMLATRHFTPVAVLWSANSQRAAWLVGKYEEFKKVEDEALKALYAAEYDPYFVSETDVATGVLEKRGTRALVLPMTLSIGQGAKKGGLAVLPALQKLVAGGGAVIATHEPAMDEFLQPAALPADLKARIAMPGADRKRLADALAGVAVGVPYTERPAGLFQCGEEVFAAYRVTLRDRTVYCFGADCPPGFEERSDLPPQAALRLHLGRIIRADARADSSAGGGATAG